VLLWLSRGGGYRFQKAKAFWKLPVFLRILDSLWRCRAGLDGGGEDDPFNPFGPGAL